MEQSKSQTNQIKQLYDQIAELEQVNRRLTISHQLTQEFVGKGGGVKHLVSLVFTRVLESLDAQAGSLWLVDKRNNQNICHLAEGPAKSGVLGLRLPLGKGVVGAVIASQEPEIILDCSKDQRFSKDVDTKTGFITRSMICVPLVIDGETYGAIQIVNKRHGVNGQFDEDDCKLVMQLAAGASLSVKNARMLEMESRVNEMSVLMAISKEVVSTLDLDQVLDYVVNKTNELVEITGGAVALFDEHKQQLKLMVLSGARRVDSDSESQQVLVKLMEQVRQSDRSAYVSDLSAYKKTIKNGENLWTTYLELNGLQAVWATPLKDDEGLLGIVWFESNITGFANGSKADLLHILSSQTTVALRNASLFKSIPFSAVLSDVGKKSRKMAAKGWRKWPLIAAVGILLIGSLHYLPIFRWVSGTAIVEAQLGRGVFLPLAGRIQEVLVTEGQQVAKGQLIARLDNAPIQLKLLELTAQFAILERQVVEARAQSDAAAMNRAAIEREGVRAKVNQARADLTQVEIIAPLAGIVLTPKPQELEGRVFAMGDEVVRLAQLDKLVVIVHIPETDLMDIHVGQQVRCVLRAQPGEYFTGIVRHVGRSYEIPSTALDSSVDLENEETRTGFIAEVEITYAPFEIRPGMTGQALIHTEKTSVIARIWRRMSNFIAFNFGF